MPTGRETDVVAPEHDLQSDQGEAEGNSAPKRVNLGPGSHHERHEKEPDERGGAS